MLKLPLVVMAAGAVWASLMATALAEDSVLPERVFSNTMRVPVPLETFSGDVSLPAATVADIQPMADVVHSTRTVSQPAGIPMGETAVKTAENIYR